MQSTRFILKTGAYVCLVAMSLSTLAWPVVFIRVLLGSAEWARFFGWIIASLMLGSVGYALLAAGAALSPTSASGSSLTAAEVAAGRTLGRVAAVLAVVALLLGFWMDGRAWISLPGRAIINAEECRGVGDWGDDVKALEATFLATAMPIVDRMETNPRSVTWSDVETVVGAARTFRSNLDRLTPPPAAVQLDRELKAGVDAVIDVYDAMLRGDEATARARWDEAQAVDNFDGEYNRLKRTCT